MKWECNIHLFHYPRKIHKKLMHTRIFLENKCEKFGLIITDFNCHAGSVMPAMTIDLEITKPCVARNIAEIVCINQRGCPKTGYCYLPDGSYNLVWSLYDEIYRNCDIEAIFEQGTWVMETYRFLDSAGCYSTLLSLANATMMNRSNLNPCNITNYSSSV